MTVLVQPTLPKSDRLLEKDPATPVHRVEQVNGRLSVRCAVAKAA